MKLEVLPTERALAVRAAERVADLIRERPTAVLGLPTGETPLGMYAELVAMRLDFRKVRTFNLDEYRALDPEDPRSYRQYMHRHLWDRVNLDPSNCHIPDGAASDPAAECARYEEAIRRAGGLDLVVLGLGLNGHIGFNEPGTAWDSRTRPVRLTPATRRANGRFFGSAGAVPAEALTMGIGTILEARRILLLAAGTRKAEVLRRMVADPPHPALPCTALQQHPDLTLLADRSAAKML